MQVYFYPLFYFLLVPFFGISGKCLSNFKCVAWKKKVSIWGNAMLLHRRLTLNSVRQRRDRSFQSYQGLNWIEDGFKCYFHVTLQISQLSLEILHACPSIFVFDALYTYIKPCSASHPVWLYSLFSSSAFLNQQICRRGMLSSLCTCLFSRNWLLISWVL